MKKSRNPTVNGHHDMRVQQPWKQLLPAPYFEQPESSRHGLDVFELTLRRREHEAALRYFDRTLTYNDLEQRSTALASILLERGFRPGDRLAASLQNMPAFVVAMIAAWKLGGSFMPINPMNRTTELGFILNDATPHTLVLTPSTYTDVYSKLEGGYRPAVVICASPFDDQSLDDLRVLAEADRTCPEGLEDLATLLDLKLVEPLPTVPRDPAAAGFLVYTSGTTGVPKAAMIAHGAIGFASTLAQPTYDIKSGATILAIAPLFHMTGLMSTLMTSLFIGGDLVLTFRFAPGTALDAMVRWRPSFTAAAPTALIALMNVEGADADAFTCFHSVAIGGAPIPPSVVRTLEGSFGVIGQPGYGLTESGGAAILAPYALAHVVPTSGDGDALAVGVPCPGIHCWVADDDGNPVEPGQLGEIIVESPANMSEYWARPDATGEALTGNSLKTGDVGFMDANGWFYLVDRKKDVIIASGFKVWPREVEDVLYSHPAVLEAAVVGAPDAYRGETVQAFLRLRPGQSSSVEEIKAFCREKLAAYKCPANVAFVDDLPKTNTGKIMRRSLRTETV